MEAGSGGTILGIRVDGLAARTYLDSKGDKQSCEFA
jgi:hypothetical protein